MKVGFYIFIGTLFIVWIAGYAVTYVFDGVDEKAACIESEGWVKGFFWCESDPKNRIELGLQATSSSISAMAWPVRFYVWMQANEDSGYSVDQYSISESSDESNSSDEKLEALRKRANDSCTQAQAMAVFTEIQIDKGKAPEDISKEMDDILHRYRDGSNTESLVINLDLVVAQEAIRIMLEEDGPPERKLEQVLYRCREFWNEILPILKLPIEEATAVK